MHKYSFPEGDFYRSSDFYDLGQSDYTVRWDLNSLLEGFLQQERLSKFAEWHGLLKRLRGNLVLEAHGDRNSDVWSYRDGGYSNSLQGWVNEHDGGYAALFLCVCNGNDSKIYSKSSLVFHFDDEISPDDLEAGVNIQTYIPRIGYLQDIFSGQELVAA